MVFSKYTHVAVGNLNIDIAIYIDRIPYPGEAVFASNIDIRPGGAASNYAVAASYYGHKVYLIASVSNHPVSEAMLNITRDHGVVIDKVKIVDDSPGLVVIVVQKDAERTMIKYPGANTKLTAEDLPLDIIKNVHLVHMASINPSLAIEMSRRIKEEPVMITYDPGIYINELSENLPSILKYIDILFLNEKEYRSLTEKIETKNLFKYGLSLLVVKMGSRGAVVKSPSEICYHAVAQPIRKPIDTTGAGDAFNAFFNAKYLESKDCGLALKYGVAAGALKVGCRGSFLCWDQKLYMIQLEKTSIEKKAECPV